MKKSKAKSKVAKKSNNKSKNKKTSKKQSNKKIKRSTSKKNSAKIKRENKISKKKTTKKAKNKVSNNTNKEIIKVNARLINKQPAEKVVWVRYPLPTGFMIFGIIGFVITYIYTSSGIIPLDWGIAMGIVFLIIIGASIRSLLP